MNGITPIVGMICAYDAHNKTNKDITLVEIKGLYRRRYFKPNIYKAVDIYDPNENILLISEELLFPSNMVIVRNPPYYPEITDRDLAVLKTLLNQSNYKEDIEKLYLKLKLYYDLKGNKI